MKIPTEKQFVAAAERSELLAQFDKARWLGLGEDQIGLEESGLRFDGENTEASLVKTLTGMSDAGFAFSTNADTLDDRVATAYIWNKYPAFAKKFDPDSDGVVSNAHYWASGGPEGMVAAIQELIAEPRDRRLMATRPLFFARGVFELKDIFTSTAVLSIHQYERIARAVYALNPTRPA